MEFSFIFGTLLLLMSTTSICLTIYLWITLKKETKRKEEHKHGEPRSDMCHRVEENHIQKATLVRKEEIRRVELWEKGDTYVPNENVRVRNCQNRYAPVNERPSLGFQERRPYQDGNDWRRAHALENNDQTETLLKIGGGVLACAGLLLSAKIRAIATVGTVTYQAYTAYKAMDERQKASGSNARYYS